MIIADEAFPLRPDLMKPFPFRNMTREQIFNYRLSRARRVVENAFGILTNRFRVFLTTILIEPSKVDLLVSASCTLHNFLRDHTLGRDHYVPNGTLDHEDPTTHQIREGTWRNDDQLADGPVARFTNYTHEAKAQRDMLKDYFISEAGSVEWQDHMV